MKKKLSMKFSKEVQEILKKALELCESKKLKFINLESVVFSTITKYLALPGDSECIELSDFLMNLSPSDKKELLDDLKNAFEYSIKRDSYLMDEKSFIELSGVKEDYPFSDIMNDVIDEAMANTNPGEELGTETMMKAILGQPAKVIDTLNTYGINPESISSNFDSGDMGSFLGKLVNAMKNGRDISNDSVGSLNDLFNSSGMGGTLKEKRLSFNGEDDKPKSPEEAKKQFEADERAFEAAGKSGAVSGVKVDPNSTTPNLDQFAVNMNLKASSDKGYDPVIGRDNEVKEIIRILSCRLCNNPMLLGDPGCGKTAIVEYLAGLIAKKDPMIPEFLINKRIFNLDVNAVVAGCMYRGQFEERMQDIIKEVIKEENIIIYIDEIHNMVGAGAGQQDKGDMANILKPFLSRGEFQCIGSTTTAEFRKVIEKDKALVRRFDPIFIGEPNISDTIEIIKGLAYKYEDYHKVKYSDEALKACVEWADRYVYDSFFPAKAIKIMDKAGADVKIARPQDKSKATELEEHIENLEKIKTDIVLSDPENWDKACEIKDKVDSLKKELDKVKDKLASDKSSWPEINVDDISTVISSTTGVPLDKIRSTDMDKVREMKKVLDKKVIGQDEAVEELSVALQQNMLGLRDPKKPIASFLFVGPTGVGKSFVSKTLAQEFFGSDKNLVTIACSEYMQDWAESKLLGSAPGYVGFDSSEPRLYILKRQPYTVLLIDEIEKSSKNLYNIWLNMLEEGEVTLSSGEKISCRNCIIIFTGNVGTKSLELKGSGIGFSKEEGEDKKKSDTATVMKEVEKEFRPEFLNRLSKIVVFNPLGKDELGKIFDNELAVLHDMILKESKLDIKVSDKVKNLIISKCEPKYGARSLKRLINEYVQKEICKKMLAESVVGKVSVKVDLATEDKINVEFK